MLRKPLADLGCVGRLCKCGDGDVAESIEVSTFDEVSSSKRLVDPQRSGPSHTLSGPKIASRFPNLIPTSNSTLPGFQRLEVQRRWRPTAHHQ